MPSLGGVRCLSQYLVGFSAKPVTIDYSRKWPFCQSAGVLEKRVLVDKFAILCYFSLSAEYTNSVAKPYPYNRTSRERVVRSPLQ